MSNNVISVNSSNRQVTFRVNNTNTNDNTEIYMPDMDFKYTESIHRDNTDVKQYLVSTSFEPQYINNQGTDLSIIYSDGKIKWSNDVNLDTLNTNELKLQNATVTATANEINILDDLNVSQLELQNLQGSTGNIQDQIDNIVNPTSLEQFGVTASNSEINK